MTPKAHFLMSLVAAGALVGTAALAAPAIEGGKRYNVTLTGANECNTSGVCNQGDPDGTGTAEITVNPGQHRVCWNIQVSGVDTIAAAHIHIGMAGQTFAGNIVVPLDPGSRCATVSNDALLDALMKAPQVFYVN